MAGDKSQESRADETRTRNPPIKSGDFIEVLRCLSVRPRMKKTLQNKHLPKLELGVCHVQGLCLSNVMLNVKGDEKYLCASSVGGRVGGGGGGGGWGAMKGEEQGEPRRLHNDRLLPLLCKRRCAAAPAARGTHRAEKNYLFHS